MSEPSVRFGRRPVDGPITQAFGDTYSGYPHRGVDFGVPEGTPVYAPCAGTVVAFTNSYTQWQGQQVRSFGIGVCLAVGDGWWVLMAHLSQSLVTIGDVVREGQIVGYSGNTGVSTGPHLHWQLSDSPGFPTDIAQSRNPLDYMEEDGMSAEDKARLDRIERIVAGNTVEGTCYPGTEDLFPPGTPVTPEGEVGPQYTLTGENALAYCDRRGFSLTLGVGLARRSLAEHIAGHTRVTTIPGVTRE